MEFRWEPEYLEFRDEVEAFIQEWRTPELLKEQREREGAGGGPILTKYYEALHSCRMQIRRSESDSFPATIPGPV